MMAALCCSSMLIGILDVFVCALIVNRWRRYHVAFFGKLREASSRKESIVKPFTISSWRAK